METKKTIFQKLLEFQAQMPEIKKTSTAKFPTKNGGEVKFSYADLSEIMQKSIPILNKIGLGIYQSFHATALKTIVFDAEGNNIDSTIILPIDNVTAQQAGSIITYFKRYSICAILGIVADDDNEEILEAVKPVQKQPQQQQAAQKWINEKELREIEDLLATDYEKGKRLIDKICKNEGNKYAMSKQIRDNINFLQSKISHQ